mmetsp:Transcript_25202/g.62105  ORF Transcript_25202/g.62105 Transcript_25202/m.62105 type:complete len:497 (-) Transcript_25202:103-1593(-)
MNHSNMSMLQYKMHFVLCLWAAMLNHSESFVPSPARVFSQNRHWDHQQAEDTNPSSSELRVHTVRDADMYEMMMGGERYEMVPLPDSMLQTTLFVGNLNEFVNDDDLSQLFAPITEWSSIPACVVRKPNMASLKYGFVTFPTEEQKQEALLRFHNAELQGKALKVEEIRDHPKKGRVRVPEKMVAYVIGGVKKSPSRSRNGEVNTMRRVSNPTTFQKKNKNKNKGKTKLTKQFSHPAKTTESQQLNEQQQLQLQQQRKKQRRPSQKKAQKYKLSSKEQQELQRALRKGYVTLEGTGFRRGRKSSNLACAHRQWCDLVADKPQIVLCKASGGRPLDCLIVDLSPLRERLLDDDDNNNKGFILGEEEEESSSSSSNESWWWNGPIVQAAEKAGMELRSDYIQDNTQTELQQDQVDLPISELPAISMGVFEGERSQAKAMARELANLWEIQQVAQDKMEYNNHSKPSKKPKRSYNSASPTDDRRQQRRQRRRRENDFFF